MDGAEWIALTQCFSIIGLDNSLLSNMDFDHADADSSNHVEFDEFYRFVGSLKQSLGVRTLLRMLPSVATRLRSHGHQCEVSGRYNAPTLLYVTGLRSAPEGNGAYVLRYGRKVNDMPVWQQRRNKNYWLFSDRYGRWVIDDGDLEAENFQKDHDKCRAYHQDKHKQELLPNEMRAGEGAWQSHFDKVLVCHPGGYKKLQGPGFDLRIYTTAGHIAEGSQVLVVHPEYCGHAGHIHKIDNHGIHIVGLPPLQIDDVIPGPEMADPPTMRRARTAPTVGTEELEQAAQASSGTQTHGGALGAYRHS